MMKNIVVFGKKIVNFMEARPVQAALFLWAVMDSTPDVFSP
jgi:hypothetical protein